MIVTSTGPSAGARRLIAAVAVAVGALVLAMCGVARGAVWIGSTHGSIQRSNRLVSGGTSWQGTFRVTSGRGGQLHGYAVVGYAPNIDVSGINNALNYIKGGVGAGLGLLGPFGSIVSATGLGSIVGVNVVFSQATAVRRGPVTGSIDNGHMTLQWGSKLTPIGYRIVMVLAAGSKRLGTGNAALRDPFAHSADIVAPGDAVSTTQSSTGGATSQRVGSYWAAQRTS